MASVDPNTARLLREIFEEESSELKDCTHTIERVKFNGGNPWVICDECGVKIRDATDEDLNRAMKRGSE
jgi:hypothetical protein